VKLAPLAVSAVKTSRALALSSGSSIVARLRVRPGGRESGHGDGTITSPFQKV
jgi:hypothetical protein